MNTIKITRSARETKISQSAPSLFSDFFSAHSADLKKYGRVYIEPVYASNTDYSVTEYVLPFDPSKEKRITKEYTINGQTLKVDFKVAVYREIDQNGNEETIEYLVPVWKEDEAMRSRWMFNELGADIEPTAIAERVKFKSFQNAVGLIDQAGRPMVGNAYAELVLGIPTGNAQIDMKRNELSSISKLNHGVSVMNFVTKRDLYKALYNFVTSDEKKDLAGGLVSLDKLGVDSFTVSNRDTMDVSNQQIIQSFTPGRESYNPGQYIRPDLDTAIAVQYRKQVGMKNETFSPVVEPVVSPTVATDMNPQPTVNVPKGGLKTKK